MVARSRPRARAQVRPHPLRLPDSSALVNGASLIRLKSYLFTGQAIASHVPISTANGMFAMYNFYREDWLIHTPRRVPFSQASATHPVSTSSAGGRPLWRRADD